MALPVTVVMYKAVTDGSLHETKEAADFCDRCNRKASLAERIIDVLQPTVYKQHFSVLAGDDGIIPYNGYKWHNTQRERERFMEELAELIIDKWNDLKPIMNEQDS